MALILQYTKKIGEQLVAAAKEGTSDTAFRGRMGISKAVWTKWCEDHPEFLEAIDLAVCCQVDFYEKILNEGLSASNSGYGEEGAMTEKERCFLARDRIKHLDAQNFKVNGTSLSASKKDWEEEEVVDIRQAQGNVTSQDAMAEFADET